VKSRFSISSRASLKGTSRQVVGIRLRKDIIAGPTHGGVALTADQMFTLCNAAVLPFWVLLAVAPRWRLTQILVHSALVPLIFGSVYAWALIFAGPPAPEGAGFGSLEGVMLLFTQPMAVLGGWVHYLIFDLFVGAWEVRDAQRRKVPHLAVVPCLLLTLMLGPVGLALYLLLRFALRRKLGLEEAPNSEALAT
jgi:hypothetical protein